MELGSKINTENEGELLIHLISPVIHLVQQGAPHKTKDFHLSFGPLESIVSYLINSLEN